MLSGHVKARDLATGKEVEPCAISVVGVTGQSPNGNLEGARIGETPAGWTVLEPIDALAGMDSRQDLLKMDWYRFENLVRQLFEAIGMTVNITQSSRDEGIDAVAYKKTDVVDRAEYLIQAKRDAATAGRHQARIRQTARSPPVRNNVLPLGSENPAMLAMSCGVSPRALRLRPIDSASAGRSGAMSPLPGS